MLFLLVLTFHERIFAVFDRHIGKQVLNRWKPQFVDGVVEDVDKIPTYIEMMIAYNQDNAICLCEAYSEEFTMFAAVPVRTRGTYKIVSSVSTRLLEKGAKGRQEYESFLEIQKWCQNKDIKLIL